MTILIKILKAISVLSILALVIIFGYAYNLSNEIEDVKCELENLINKAETQKSRRESFEREEAFEMLIHQILTEVSETSQN